MFNSHPDFLRPSDKCILVDVYESKAIYFVKTVQYSTLQKKS